MGDSTKQNIFFLGPSFILLKGNTKKNENTLKKKYFEFQKQNICLFADYFLFLLDQ